MKKTAILLVSFGFFALGSCSKQLATNGEITTPEIDGVQTALFRLAPDAFTPPTRTRGKKWNNVRSYGAVGNGIADDTIAFQKAIDALPEDGGTVFVPPGTYVINSDIKDLNRKDVEGNSIRLRSHMHLQLSDHAILKAKPTNAYAHYVVYGYQVSDVEISGGRIIGERDQHSGTDTEGGRGIQLRGCDGVTIRNVHLSNFWGDGISIGTTWEADPGPKVKSNDVVIYDVVSTGNRRQGLSIGPATNVQVWNSEFSDTEGTAPQCGIDIEPEKGQFTDNVLIQNCIMRNNHAYGVLLFKNQSNVTIKNCEIVDNNIAGIVCDSPVDTYITSNRIHNNTNNGLVIKVGVKGMTVDQNTFYENNSNLTRPTPLEITGMNEETEKDIFIRPGATNVNIGKNFYR